MLSLLGCSFSGSNPNLDIVSTPNLNPTELYGVVKSESINNRIGHLDRYKFSFITREGDLKLFVCARNDHASNLDALIDPGDTVKVRLYPAEEFSEDNESSSCRNVLEINGNPLPTFHSFP